MNVNIELNEETAKLLIGRGEAVDLDSRLPAFAGQAIVQVGKVKRTPRSATLELAHCQRMTEKPARAVKTKEKSVEQLRAAVAEDRAERFEEEQLRMELYNDLTMEARKAWIVEVLPDEYDAAERQAWGRPLFTNYSDERTPGGIGVDVDPLLCDGEFEDFESEMEIEIESEQSDDETAEEVLAGYQEMETHVTK